jgi:hypothetical protein
MESKFKMPTETVELPSKGLVYSKESPLSLGTVEMKYMTAKEEDILTNQNYIKDGTILDRLLESLIVDKNINYEDLIIGDKNAIMVASRILGYGKDYTFEYRNTEVTVDLSKIEPNFINEADFEQGKNAFTFTLPTTGAVIEYKLLNGKDERLIKQEIKGLQKINKNVEPTLSTRLKHMILSVDGDSNKNSVREFVDNYFLAKDSRAFRTHLKRNQPNVDLTFNFEQPDGELIEDISIPITANFFWPDE